MNSVNPYFLHTLVEPFTGLADDDDAVRAYVDLDPNDEPMVRAIIRKTIVPHAASLSVDAVERVKLSYRYYLSKPDSDFDRVFYSNLPPFNAPDDPRKLFLWIWEECFPGQDFLLPSLDQYFENRDIEEPMRFKPAIPE